jgi:hypothetical protein
MERNKCTPVEYNCRDLQVLQYRAAESVVPRHNCREWNTHVTEAWPHCRPNIS